MASGEGVMDLDRLIQTCEFENKQYVKLIEKENQQIEALEREIEEKQRGCLKLEDAISQLDEDTKRAHKQFTLNRDNCDSLRKTMVVLMEHEVALNRKHNCLIANGEDERLHHDGVVKHYEGIYVDYMAKYRKFPLVTELLVYEEEISKKEILLQEIQEKIDGIKTQIDVAQGGSEVNFKNLNKFITKLAETKVDTLRAVSEKIQFEAELREIQNKNSRQDEVQSREDQHTTARTTEDSFGEDMSTMIGIFHNKSDAEGEEVNTNNSADILQPIANLSIRTPDCKVKYVDDPSRPEEQALEIPVTRMSDVRISPPQPSPSRAPCPPPAVAVFRTPVPSMIPPSSPRTVNRESSPQLMNFAPTVSQVNMNRAPATSSMILMSPQIPQIRAPVCSPQQPITIQTQIIPKISSNRPQPVLIQTIAAQSVQNQPRSFTPKQVETPQIQMVARQSPKIKHGVSSIQTRPIEVTPPVRQTRPAQLIASHEQRKPPPSPRLPVTASPQIRAPPCLPIPPPPLTPEHHKGFSSESAGVQRFLSPVTQPHPHHHTVASTISAVPRQLYATPGSSSPTTYHTPTTPITSRHFDTPASDQASVSNKNDQNNSSEDVVMESPDRSKSLPTTPGRMSDLECNSKSPFDLEKHIQKINMLSKSPGGPIYSQRPMFENADGHIGAKSPGPFMQAFNTQSMHAERPECEQQTTVTMRTSASETHHRPSEMRSLFGGQDTPERPPTQMAETSFMFGGNNDRPISQKPEASFMFGHSSERPPPGASFMSMFGSGDFQSPPTEITPQNNFSFSFGQEETPKSTGQDFSFSFGGNRSNDERSPSVFNLF